MFKLPERRRMGGMTLINIDSMSNGFGRPPSDASSTQSWISPACAPTKASAASSGRHLMSRRQIKPVQNYRQLTSSYFRHFFPHLNHEWFAPLCSAKSASFDLDYGPWNTWIRWLWSHSDDIPEKHTFIKSKLASRRLYPCVLSSSSTTNEYGLVSHISSWRNSQ